MEKCVLKHLLNTKSEYKLVNEEVIFDEENIQTDELIYQTIVDKVNEIK